MSNSAPRASQMEPQRDTLPDFLLYFCETVCFLRFGNIFCFPQIRKTLPNCITVINVRICASSEKSQK